MSEAPLIALNRVTFAYPGGPPVLRELDFSLHRGERIGIAAPNGSGKTTLFHIIMGLLTPAAGTVSLFGRVCRREADFVPRRQRIGLLFQDADDQLFSPTVIEDVAFGPLNLGHSRDEAVATARRTLGFLGLEGFADRITFKLSGGEKRLVALATVLAMEPEVLLLDEPTAGLDERTKTRLTAVLQELELAHVVISHEIDFLSVVADPIYTLEDGRIVLEEQLHVHSHRHAHRAGRIPHRHV